MYSCLYVCGVTCTVDAGKGKMSTWLHDGWIEANRPKSTGDPSLLDLGNRGECVTSTDSVAMG